MILSDLVPPYPKFSTYFGGAECTVNRHGYVIPKIPAGVASRMEAQATLQMERIRSECADDSPIRVTRWLADEELNYLQGGVKDSQHTLGEAIDWTTPSAQLRLVFERLVRPADPEKPIPFDQAIYYPKRGFVHTSLRSGARAPGNRRQVLFCPFTKAEATARKRARKKVYFAYDEHYAAWEKDPATFVREH